MNCRDARMLVHEHLDRELSGTLSQALEEHLGCCSECRGNAAELALVQRLVAVRTHMPASLRKDLLANIQRRRQGRLSWARWRPRLSSLLGFWRDLEPGIVWSRVGAIPISLAFFVLLLTQIAGGRFIVLSYPLALPEAADGSKLTVTIIERQDPDKIDRLIEAVEGLPFEDEMSVVASLKPSGRMAIDDIREYPRSQKVMDAAILNIRSSRFEAHQEQLKVFHFFYHKIDVYENGM